jgi:hypothetical protein
MRLPSNPGSIRLLPVLLALTSLVRAADPVAASWDGVMLRGARDVREQEVALEGGGTAVLRRPDVALDGASVSVDGAALRIVCERPGARVELTPDVLRLPRNWSGFADLELRVAADRAVTLAVTVVLPRGRLTRAFDVAEGRPVTVTLPLADSALASATRPLHEPNGLRLEASWRARDAFPRVVRVETLTLRPRVGPPAPIVDAFGQRASTTWPGKVTSLDDLRLRVAAEERALAELVPPAGRDRFGGSTAGPKFAATGFFRVERDARGYWWFVTPEGSPFWSLGTTGARVGSINDTAQVAGREHLFAALPERSSPAWFEGRQTNTTGDVFLQGNVHFYRWNVLRKYGSFEAWRDRVLTRWERWGLNTLGSWSDELMLAQTRIPHTRFLRARAELPGVVWHHGVPDVWDPAWERAVDEEFARDTAGRRDDPWLVGYFVDNEGPWRNLRLLDFPATAPLRKVWRDHARERYVTIAAFNASWGTAFTEWSEVEGLKAAQVPASGEARDAMTAFEAVYADRYAATVKRLLRRHAPNHLYLGCRFVRNAPDAAIVAAIGRHVDVLSVNCYSRVPEPGQFGEWHRMSGGKPILIGEFHTPLESPRQLPPPYQAFPEAEREAIFGEFIDTWIRQPWSVGCHWYQHADQPPTGRHTDGENQTVGLVDITDTPHEHMVRAFRAAAERIYRVRDAER